MPPQGFFLDHWLVVEPPWWQANDTWHRHPADVLTHLLQLRLSFKHWIKCLCGSPGEKVFKSSKCSATFNGESIFSIA
jgi:hypothetical protein